MLKNLFGKSKNTNGDKMEDSVIQHFQKLFGGNLTRAEVVDKILALKAEDIDADEAENEDEADDDNDADKPTKTKASKKAKKKEESDDDDQDDDEDQDDDQDDDQEDSVNETVQALVKKVARLEKNLMGDMKALTQRLTAIEKAPGRKATSGLKDVVDTPKKGEYTDKQAPVFYDEN
jgi:TATA-binding protein-associated factor Taf7